MFSLFNTIQIDPTIATIVGFVYLLAVVAVYKMRNFKQGVLFLIFITAAAFIIFIFIKYSILSSIVILLYIVHLLRHKARSDS